MYGVGSRFAKCTYGYAIPTASKTFTLVCISREMLAFTPSSTYICCRLTIYETKMRHLGNAVQGLL
jgi:hypothetical protein